MTISATAPLRVMVLLISVGLALLLLLAGTVLAGTAASGTTSDADGGIVVATVTHEVRYGDTLWSIASGFTPPGDDVRRTIHDIQVANGLTSSEIVVGQSLLIPTDF